MRLGLYALGLAGAAALGAWGMSFVGSRAGTVGGEGERQEAHAGHEEHAEGVVEMSPAKQESAGIVVEPARRGDLVLSKTVTGKVTPNEDRLAHIYSLVEGTVHEVQVRYGDKVRKGEVLATIDSKEVGQAKLALVQDRLQVRIAKVNLKWKQTIAENTQALIRELDAGITPAGIAERFHDKPMGTYREEILSAYARVYQTRAEHERTKALSERGSLSQREYEKARADHEAAQATFNALKEQARFTTDQESIQAQQAMEQAMVAEGTSRSALYILGYRENQVRDMDPLVEGEEVAHYGISAPFDGTILEKDVVVDERVGPQTKLFDLADLSMVWVRADIFEKDLSGLAELKGETIRFGSASYPGRTFEARVFYTGEQVDPNTRTVPMMATAGNPGNLLKPGLFVEVQLPTGTVSSVVQVPKSAVQTDGGETFVFVKQAAGEFEKRAISVGRESAEMVEVVEGLKEGEPVAIRGTFSLKAELKRGEMSEGGHHH
jgi:cobalt-zinc-cadmium efflux system membrane fusion protein